MSEFKGPYRQVQFSEPQRSGAYVTVYQRPGERVLLDLNFFEGDRDVDGALLLKRLLDAAIEQGKKWSNE